MSFYRALTKSGSDIIARFHEAERKLFEACGENEDLVKAAFVNGVFPEVVALRMALNEIHDGIVSGTITFRADFVRAKK
jgi:hypothetical protein